MRGRRQWRIDRSGWRRGASRSGGYAKDLFVSLDVDGVSELIALAIERGRAARGSLRLGICGENGGDPATIVFCEQAGLDYVSASLFGVPVARLAAAHASLRRWP